MVITNYNSNNYYYTALSAIQTDHFYWCLNKLAGNHDDDAKYWRGEKRNLFLYQQPPCLLFY